MISEETFAPARFWWSRSRDHDEWFDFSQDWTSFWLSTIFLAFSGQREEIHFVHTQERRAIVTRYILISTLEKKIEELECGFLMLGSEKDNSKIDCVEHGWNCTNDGKSRTKATRILVRFPGKLPVSGMAVVFQWNLSESREFCVHRPWICAAMNSHARGVAFVYILTCYKSALRVLISDVATWTFSRLQNPDWSRYSKEPLQRSLLLSWNRILPFDRSLSLWKTMSCL